MAVRLSLLVTVLVSSVLPSCATKYQNLLMDRDAEIRDLKGQLANLQAAREDFTVREPAPASIDPGETGVDANELARVRSDLPGMDVHERGGRLTIDIPSTVTFDSGSIALKSASHRSLRDVADVLRRDYGGRRIFVQGHTDTDPIQRTKGRYRTNRHLSFERADAVAAFLIESCGVPESSVVVAGYGPHDPRDPGSSDTAKAKNRRVEIVVGERL